VVSQLKAVAKRAVVHAVARTAPLTWRWRKPGSLIVLMYHRVLPKDSPARRTEQPGMYVSPETLDLHLRELKQQHFELMHLDEWLRRSKDGLALPRLACAITFDDGWRDNYDFALPVLARHGAPAAIFLVSGYIGTTYAFWPNRLLYLLRRAFADRSSVVFPEPLSCIVEPVLAKAVAGGELRDEDVDAVVEGAKGWDEEEVRALVETAEKSCTARSEGRDILNRDEIAQMAASGLVRFGSHTKTHFRLGGRISSEELGREIVDSRKHLQELSGQPIDLFCYPNGETSSAAIDLVRRHYLGAVTTRSGWHSAGADSYLVRRIGVHEDVSSAREPFLQRLSGWL
jgi:peptidoglycan/xylan/chitin deacetylase (PgdA/CDA1 family)